MAQLLDGKRVRDQIMERLKPRVEALARSKRRPGLGVVLVGHHPASEVYVRNKVKGAEELGICSETIRPPELISTSELVQVIEQLNRAPDIDGILVQLPLPPQVDAKTVLLAVSPDKDVDGFHPCNVGRLVTGQPGLRPCTPAGILELLRSYGIPIAGKRAVVVGRSDIVGKPMAMLLLHEHATVTICHSRTADLASICREADILIAAMGRTGLLTAEYIRPGAVVVDVGMNRITDRADAVRVFRDMPDRLALFDQKGSALVGDVHPADVAQRAAAYTPVPGGVGPLTIAMLMANTVEAAEKRLGLC